MQSSRLATDQKSMSVDHHGPIKFRLGPGASGSRVLSLLRAEER